MGSVEIIVRVAPGERRERLQKQSPGEWLVSVKEPAEGGRANARVREMVAREFGVPLHAVHIEAGYHSQKKRLVVRVSSA